MTKIAIVGRPNVGKSTLFNRILGKRIAIVDSTSGVTRDRNYGDAEWHGKKFTIIDTGGIELAAKDEIKKQVLEQIKISIDEADLIIFVADIIDGLVPLDKEISRLLHRSGKKVIIAVNKVDNEKLYGGIPAFSALGWQKIIRISSGHGLGINNLLDAVSKEIPEAKEEPYEVPPLRIAVIGRPNVGKSTFVNAVLCESRMIVDEMPGTTRDAVDVRFKRNDTNWVFIDTAGIRKRKNVKSPLEYYSVNRALKSIDRADIVVFMIDGWEGIMAQDAQLADYIIEKKRPCIIAVNKWDLVKEVSKKEYSEKIRERLAEYRYIPAIFISALKKDNIDSVLDEVEELVRQSCKKIPTGILNRMIHSLEMVRPLKIYYGTQIKVNPPTFKFFVNKIPGNMHIKYVENQLHKLLNLEIPINLMFQLRSGRNHGKF